MGEKIKTMYEKVILNKELLYKGTNSWGSRFSPIVGNCRFEDKEGNKYEIKRTSIIFHAPYFIEGETYKIEFENNGRAYSIESKDYEIYIVANNSMWKLDKKTGKREKLNRPGLGIR